VRVVATCLLLPFLAIGESHAQQTPAGDESSWAVVDPAAQATPADQEGPAQDEGWPDTLRTAIARRGTSSRLFYMPIADTVGAYEMTLSYDGSLLEEPGVLSSAGVFALGVGDLAQIDYRHTSAIGVNGGSVPLPAVGVQLKLPFDTGDWVPAIAISYRLGVEHHENNALEKATDLYGVVHLALPLGVDVHGGVRVTQATMEFGGAKDEATKVYPAIGITHDFSETSTTILEVGRAPRFSIENDLPSVASGVTGRLGLRGRLHPRFALDASAGYLAQGMGTSATDFLAWDIRLGGEIFVPWGALACESLALFCK
jgi:hypothetical protein